MSGSIGSGKTTFAEYLANTAEISVHFESWQIYASNVARYRMRLSRLSQPRGYLGNNLPAFKVDADFGGIC